MCFSLTILLAVRCSAEITKIPACCIKSDTDYVTGLHDVYYEEQKPFGWSEYNLAIDPKKGTITGTCIASPRTFREHLQDGDAEGPPKVVIYVEINSSVTPDETLEAGKNGGTRYPAIKERFKLQGTFGDRK